MCEARIAAVVVLFTAGSLLAQVTGRVTGTVLDPTGASVPNARVGLYLPDGKSALLTTATNAEGIFDFIAVRPDLYRLQIEAPGFTTFQREEVKVDPAREQTLPPIRLGLAGTRQAQKIDPLRRDRIYNVQVVSVPLDRPGTAGAAGLDDPSTWGVSCSSGCAPVFD